MLPPLGTKLEKQKPRNLEYIQNQRETKGGKLIKEETTLEDEPTPSARLIA
jgi:hypothetical protein